jgi:hypothetical protein
LVEKSNMVIALNEGYILMSLWISLIYILRKIG